MLSIIDQQPELPFKENEFAGRLLNEAGRLIVEPVSPGRLLTEYTDEHG
jgi:hypothetical protein